MLTCRDDVLNGGGVFNSQSVKRDMAYPFDDVANTISFCHRRVHAVAKGKDVFNVRSVRLPGMLGTPIELSFRHFGMDVRFSKNPTDLLSKSRPIREAALVVKKPRFRDIGQIEGDVTKFLRLIPLVINTGHVVFF